MESSISRVAPLEAVLFNIDGTMCISDPFHHMAFSELLEKIGYNSGIPITLEFGMKHMAGRNNEQIGKFLFPDWDQESLDRFFKEKEALFARYATEQLKEINGLSKLCQWVHDHGLKHAAVTNALRGNAELIVLILGLLDFFQLIVTGEECEQSKPSPDPYLRAVELLQASPDHSVVFEDSVIGVQAGVAAGMPVIAVAEESRQKPVVAAGAALVIRDFEDAKLWATLEEMEKAEANVAT